MCEVKATAEKANPQQIIKAQLPRTIALVGLMGAGKTCIGKLVARALNLSFIDADQEIEKAAGMTVAEIFEQHGEACFRSGERRVIQRLLGEEPCVLSTGGGAFMDPQTRTTMMEQAIVIWLRADLDTLVDRTARRNHRPLLKDGNHRNILSRLMDERHPVYAQAHVSVESTNTPPEQTRDAVLDSLACYLAAPTASTGKPGTLPHVF